MTTRFEAQIGEAFALQKSFTLNGEVFDPFYISKVVLESGTFSVLATVLETDVSNVTPLTGTVIFTELDDDVTGSGTAFLTEVTVGQLVKLDSDSEVSWTRVLAVNTNTSLTLATAYRGITGSAVASVGDSPIQQISAGTYEVQIPALDVSGTFYDQWYYTPFEGAADMCCSGSVEVVDVECSSPEVDPDDGDPPPDTNVVCNITHTFIDAAGRPVSGITVEFCPEALSTSNQMTQGLVVSCVSDTSGDDGAVSFYVLHGLCGVLTITGTGLVRRQVCIPDSGASCDLFDLVSAAPDPFEMQDIVPVLISLPRRSS